MPGAISDYHRAGGVLAFAFFAETNGTEADARDAIAAALEHECADWPAHPDGTPRATLNRPLLPLLPSRVLTRAAFLGDWVDVASGTRLFSNGYIASRGSSIPELWSGGQFGYAFSTAPYRMRVDAERVQTLFDAVCALILPARRTCTILDWGSEALLDLCPAYFEDGTEWWGVFLFTVHVAEEGRTAVILGSATD